MDKIITDPVTGKRLGRLAESNSEIVAYDSFNKVVGRYIKSRRITEDGNHNKIANGDITESLLRR